MRAFPLPKDNFRNKALNLSRQTAQVSGAPHRIAATRQPLRLSHPENSENQDTVAAQGVLGNVVTGPGWETATKRGHREGGALTGLAEKLKQHQELRQ
jgi:hypothetical protein